MKTKEITETDEGYENDGFEQDIKTYREAKNNKSNNRHENYPTTTKGKIGTYTKQRLQITCGKNVF